MRVLYWTELFWPYIGGVPVSSTRLIPALVGRSYDIIVVTSRESLVLPDEDQYKGVPIYRFPFAQTMETHDLDQLSEVLQGVAKLKRAFKPDLVHLHFPCVSAFYHLHTAAAHPASFLVTLRGALPGTSIGSDTLQRLTLRSADWVTGVSAAVLARARELAPEITSRSSVIHNAVDVSAFIPEPLPSHPPRLIYLGRLYPEKGVDLVLTAFGTLVERFPDARLVIAGDGPLRTELEQLAFDLRVANSVDFVGWVTPEKVPALLNSATVVVMPSRSEGLPQVALEAGLMARPVVATRVGGLPEVVVHEQTGLLVEPEDAKALAEAIALLLDHPAMAAQMGQAARRRAAAVFNWDRYVDAYDDMYQKLIKGFPLLAQQAHLLPNKVGFASKMFDAGSD